jgi:capsular polysaccharide biosynthesis protein
MNSVSRPDSYELSDYTGVLRRRWPIVLGVTLICLIGTVGYIVAAPKIYSSSANVYVNPTGNINTNQLSGSRTSGTVNLDTEAQIVTSGVVATAAGKILHSSLTPDVLASEILVSVPANSQNLVISCIASTGTGAAACANAFAAAYLQNRSAAASSAIQQQIAPLKTQVGSLEKTVAALSTSVRALPVNSAQRNAAQAQLSFDHGQLSNLTDTVASLYDQAAQTNGGTIITTAHPPGNPIKPEKTLVLPSGFVVGLVLGLIGAWVQDRRDRRVRTARDVERFFRLPVLLSLPLKSSGRQIALASPRSRTGKAFTELAHNVAASLGEGSHVLLVAGASPGPAVSVVAANLAATLARTHSEAVLVCAALRDSIAPELFGLADGRGLAEVLAGRATVGEVARGPASAPGLWVIPPGADTSLAEYNLQHDTAKALTTQLRRDARYIIIEAQSNEDGADTFALAEFADAALITVEAQRTTRTEGDTCIRRLRQMRTQLLGAAVLPPVKAGVSVRPPQQSQSPLVGTSGGQR